MTVAYAKTRVGSAEQRMFVRDAVTADVVAAALPGAQRPRPRGAVAAQCSTARPATIAWSWRRRVR